MQVDGAFLIGPIDALWLSVGCAVENGKAAPPPMARGAGSASPTPPKSGRETSALVALLSRPSRPVLNSSQRVGTVGGQMYDPIHASSLCGQGARVRRVVGWRTCACRLRGQSARVRSATIVKTNEDFG